MSERRALITGASGQDGWYLARYLVNKGYGVHAQSRRAGSSNYPAGVVWHVGNIADPKFLSRLVSEASPDEIYNLAAISAPHQSWQVPFETAAVNALVPQHLCEIIKSTCPSTRLFQASSSDMFGAGMLETQNEQSAFNPGSPYAISKAYAHQTVRAYRQQYGLHLSTGVLFNHESPRRPLKFVSQKIAHAAALISLGIHTSKELDERGEPILLDRKLRLGSLETRRDFGFAGDYVEAMHAIVRNDIGDDFVVGTGITHSIAEFCNAAFGTVGVDWREHVVVDPAFIRKADAHTKADPRKLTGLMGRSFKTSFADLVSLMVSARIGVLKTTLST